MKKNVDGQMSLFDLDGWSGRMSPEPSAQTMAKTSVPSSKKQQGLLTKLPLFLDLQRGNGHQPDVSWVMGGALLGEFTMHSFGECPREERESRLSQILQGGQLQKYYLSEKACQGILRRAQSRGKKLPEILEKALIKQSAFKNEQENQGGGKGILIQNEKIGALSTLNNQSVCAEANGFPLGFRAENTKVYDEKSTTICNGTRPGFTCGVIQEIDAYNQTVTGNVSMSMTAKNTDAHHVPCVLEGNGSRPSHSGDGYSESEVMYTLNSTEHHAVCIGNGQMCNITMKPVANTLDTMHDQQAVLTINGGKVTPPLDANYYRGCGVRNGEEREVVCYAIDRASFNQGQNAQFGFSVQEDLAQTIVAKGPGGGIDKTIGALCARDYKGVGNQYVSEGKLILQDIGKSSG